MTFVNAISNLIYGILVFMSSCIFEKDGNVYRYPPFFFEDFMPL